MNINEPYHMAIIYKKHKNPFQFLHSKILHAYIDDNHPDKGQVGETILLYTHTIVKNETISNTSYFHFAV